jgi:hypothetical protein
LGVVGELEIFYGKSAVAAARLLGLDDNYKAFSEDNDNDDDDDDVNDSSYINASHRA